MKQTVKWSHRLFGTRRSTRFRRPKHRTLTPLLRLPELLNRRIGFVTVTGRNRYTWIPSRFFSWVISEQMKHFGMALNVWRDNDAELFLMSEHKADYSLLLYLTFFLKRKPVFFFVHDMQQTATLTTRCRLALNLCRLWVRCGEFYPIFISLDDSILDPDSRFSPEKELTIPHPHHLAECPPPPRKPRVPGARFRVGIIGGIRKEKPIKRLLDILQEAQKKLGFDLVVGTSFSSKPDWLDELGLEIADTSTEAQYSECLSSLDIFVVDFLKSEYYFRPSGAVVDAGMNGCYVICPDFPVFREQISQPVSIGATFQNLDELPALLEKAMAELEVHPVETETWRAYHKVERIAELFRAFLEQRAATTDMNGRLDAVPGNRSVSHES
jgi:glycosyltransferase involved in cell wall biosynthesis